MRRLATGSIIYVLIALMPVFAQAPPGSVVIGSGSFSPIVKDLDKSLAFYRNLLEVSPPAGAAPAAFGTDKALLNFLGTPTAQVRFNTVRIPGTTMNVEIVEFKDIDRKPVQPRLQDPGAVMLVLLVRDVDSLFNRLKKEGVSVVTTSGAPVNVGRRQGDKTRGVVIKDPDGFHIALLQLDPLAETTAPASSNVIGSRFALTVANTDQAMRIYRDQLGLTPQTQDFFSDRNVDDFLNTPGAQLRHSTAQVPGSPLSVEFLEFKNIDRKPIVARIQDPGATRLQLRVRDTDATVKALQTAGGEVITTGGSGGPIDMRGLRVAVVRELDNLFLVIMTQIQQPAAGQRR
jgi:catechol 2,3-dioxygenase-like lactoylglutathione lyase family enzyme